MKKLTENEGEEVARTLAALLQMDRYPIGSRIRFIDSSAIRGGLRGKEATIRMHVSSDHVRYEVLLVGPAAEGRRDWYAPHRYVTLVALPDGWGEEAKSP